MNFQIFTYFYRKETVYSLKEGARSSLRSLGFSVWREIKLAHVDLGIPLTLCNFLDYDDFESK